MKFLNSDSLKTYKDKISEYASKVFQFETADDSDITDLMEGIHKYKISIFPKAFSRYYTNSMCRLNIHKKSGKLELTNVTSKSCINCNAVYDNKYNLHFYSETGLYTSLGSGVYYPPNGSTNFPVDTYCLESVLEGEGQCLGGQNNPNTYKMEFENSELDRIEFFPSWNAYGYYSQYYNSRFSNAVTVKVECDGKEVFNGEITGLVKYDRVKIVFDKFNEVHLEKFNVGNASAFEQYY